MMMMMIMLLMPALCCQECDIGYKRSGGGFYLGTCDRCNCNGHADECGEIDGLCIVSCLYDA